MSKTQCITCIVCPRGCKILVKSDGTHLKIEGQKCQQGIDYARHEALDPRRMLTTSILVYNGEWPLVSVKSTQPIPKKDIFSVLQSIKQVQVQAPVTVGQILISNVAHTGIDIVATKTIRQSNSR